MLSVIPHVVNVYLLMITLTLPYLFMLIQSTSVTKLLNICNRPSVALKCLLRVVASLQTVVETYTLTTDYL